MNELFSNQWVSDDLPEFMQVLLKEIDKGYLNLQIFVLKLLVNNQDLFKPFAHFWITPICNFINSKKRGGKGFHYFLRDLTTLLILWSDEKQFKPTDKQKELCCLVVNNLVKLAADKNKIIFNINIELLAMLLHKWKSFITLDKE